MASTIVAQQFPALSGPEYWIVDAAWKTYCPQTELCFVNLVCRRSKRHSKQTWSASQLETQAGQASVVRFEGNYP